MKLTNQRKAREFQLYSYSLGEGSPFVTREWNGRHTNRFLLKNSKFGRCLLLYTTIAFSTTKATVFSCKISEI